jgi:hypothetical protein
VSEREFHRDISTKSPNKVEEVSIMMHEGTDPGEVLAKSEKVPRPELWLCPQ